MAGDSGEPGWEAVDSTDMGSSTGKVAVASEAEEGERTGSVEEAEAGS